MSKVVHSDQTGFVPDRCWLNNLRPLFNIIYSSNFPQDFAIFSLDAEKAFKQVEWPLAIPFCSPREVSVGWRINSWIKLLYKNLMARVLTNQNVSTQSKLCRGTRQERVLSPLFSLEWRPFENTLKYMGTTQYAQRIKSCFMLTTSYCMYRSLKHLF